MHIVQNSAFMGLTVVVVWTFLSVIASHSVMYVYAFVYRICNVATVRSFQKPVGHGLHH